MSLGVADLATLSVGPSGFLVAGLRRRRITLSRGLTDVSHQNSGDWQVNQASQAPAEAELRGDGLFVSSAAQATLRGIFLEGKAELFQLTLPGEGVWEGAFFVQTLTIDGEAEAELTFSVRLRSSGPLTFSPLS